MENNVAESTEDEKSFLFDYSRFLDRVLGDENTAGAVLKIFCRDMPNRFEALRQALERNDVQTCERMAHTIKGASRNIEANALSRISGMIELVSRAGELDKAKEYIIELKIILNSTVEKISEKCGLASDT